MATARPSPPRWAERPRGSNGSVLCRDGGGVVGLRQALVRQSPARQTLAQQTLAQQTPARLVLLLLALAAIVSVLTGCGGGRGQASPRDLAALVADAAGNDGRSVIVEGHVRRHPDPRHHWLEDDAGHRVGLVPDAAVAPHVGSRVRITGTFRAPAAPDTGRRIEVVEVVVLTARTDASGPLPPRAGGT